MAPREDLRALRQRRRVTMREVEIATARIAFQFSDKRYLVLRSHLSGYERQKSTPSLFKFYSLLMVYGCSPKRLLASFGIPGRKGGKTPLAIKPSLSVRLDAPAAEIHGPGTRRRGKGSRTSTKPLLGWAGP